MMGDRAVPAVPAEGYPCSVNASVAAVCRPIAPVTFAFSARGSGQAFRVSIESLVWRVKFRALAHSCHKEPPVSDHDSGCHPKVPVLTSTVCPPSLDICPL